MDFDLFVLVVISTMIFELVDGEVLETVKRAVIKKSRQMLNILGTYQSRKYYKCTIDGRQFD